MNYYFRRNLDGTYGVYAVGGEYVGTLPKDRGDDLMAELFGRGTVDEWVRRGFSSWCEPGPTP